jgi:hypothetical protein
VGIKISTTTMESIIEIPQNLKIELSYNPVIAFLGIYPKGHKTRYNRDNCTPMFIEALFTVVKLCKQSRCPTTDEITNMFCIYTMECC